MKNQIPFAAWERLDSLQAEEEKLKKDFDQQYGTAIPKLFYQMNSYVTNPSAVGTGVMSRMIETDDAISSSIQFKILMILSKIGDYHHDNAEISDFVNGFIKRLKGPTWQESLQAMLSCKGYGFSVSEPVYSIDSKLRKVPVRIPTYHPNTVAFEVDEFGSITEDGVIQFILQHTQFTNPNNRTAGSIQYGNRVTNPFVTPTDRVMPYRIPFLYQYGLVRIPRKKIIHMVNLPMFSFGNPYGKTEVRTAHLAWQLKQFLMRQLGIAAKRNANGFIWGQAPGGTQKVKTKLPDGSEVERSPRDALQSILGNRENDDAVVTGSKEDGWGIDAIPAAGTLEQYTNVMKDLDVRIFRCFLLPDLVMTSGESGSRSLGDKHWEIVDTMAANEAGNFMESIMNDMIIPVIQANFGEQEDYGKFKERAQSWEEKDIMARIFSTLVTSGIMKNHVKDDLNFMRQEMGLPKDTDTTMDFDSITVNDVADKLDPEKKEDEPKDEDKPE